MSHEPLTDAEVRRRARVRAGSMLRGVLNVWEPDELTEELGPENVERIVDEITRIARRLSGN